MFVYESTFPEINFPHSDIWTYNDILVIRLKPELIIESRYALEMQIDWATLEDKKKGKVLVDLNDMIYIDQFSRKLCSTQVPGFIRSIAIYTNNKYLQTIGKAFILIDSPAYRSKVFNDINRALEWLKTG